MSLVGRLEDLALSDIFQIISLSKKTGTLLLKGKSGAAVVVFKSGQVIQAATDNLRDTLGNILVTRGLVGEEALSRALEVQKSSGGKRLGRILVEAGALSQDDLEQTIRGQIEDMIYSLLAWEEGYFNFELGEVSPGDKIEVITQEFLLRSGINPEYLLMEGARMADERKRDGRPAPAAQGREAPEAEDPLSTRGAPDFSGFFDQDGPQAPSPAALAGGQGRLGSLKAMFEELRFPTATAEITLLVLRYASEFIGRAVLFMVTREEVKGLGQFGIELKEGSADHKVRKICVPVAESSIFQEAIRDRRTVRGLFSKNAWDTYLVDELGGEEPDEFLLIPLVSNGKVVAVLYGDNLPEKRPVGDITGLEIFVHQAGMAMEKALLERKLGELEKFKAGR